MRGPGVENIFPALLHQFGLSVELKDACDSIASLEKFEFI
jgi:hypothetical protein